MLKRVEIERIGTRIPFHNCLVISMTKIIWLWDSTYLVHNYCPHLLTLFTVFAGQSRGTVTLSASGIAANGLIGTIAAEKAMGAKGTESTILFTL